MGALVGKRVVRLFLKRNAREQRSVGGRFKFCYSSEFFRNRFVLRMNNACSFSQPREYQWILGFLLLMDKRSGASRLLKNSFWWQVHLAGPRSRRGFAAIAVATARNRNAELGLARCA